MTLGEDYGQGLHELLRQVLGYNARATIEPGRVIKAIG